MTKLMIAVMYSDTDLYTRCKSELVNEFGMIDAESEAYDFDKFTKFYEKEMGTGLVKRFIIFREPMESMEKNKSIKDNLKKIKLKTAETEKSFSSEGRRKINLDPGYLTESELALASFKKGAGHKKDIGGGVFLHKVLEFKDRAIIFRHTFPDYRVKENQAFFQKHLKQ
jgi:hypothetical protein